MKRKIKAIIICLLALTLTMSYTLLPVNAEGNDEVETVDIIKISSAEELLDFAKRVNGGETSLNAILTANIDMKDQTYTPIGTIDYRYSGTFEGNGKIVTFNISSTSSDIGLFGYINGATIQNVGVAGKINTTSGYAGGIVANVYGDSTIKGCWNEAEIKANTSAVGIASYIGSDSNVTIENCYNTGTVTANNYAGGIAGWFGSNSNVKIENCYNTRTITANNYAGGIAGLINSNSNVKIENCYNTGDVTASNRYAGGIAGLFSSDGSITNCYNTGDVTANTDYAGGIAGLFSLDGSITNCYNTGTVTVITESNTYAGGIAGCGFGNITNCYYLEDSSSSAGGGTSKTEIQFNSGEVILLLNVNKSEGVWKQTLGTEGDVYPNFTGLTVCYDETSQEYYNTAPTPSIDSSSVTTDSITIKLGNYDDKEKYGDIRYSLNNEDWNEVILNENNSFTIADLKAGTTYTIYLRYTGAGNIKGTIKAEFANVTITTKYENSWTTAPTIEGWTYDSPNTPTAEAKYGTDVTFTYYTDENCTKKTTTDNSITKEEGGQPVNAGTYYMKASVAEGDTYEGLVSDAIPFAINKASQSTPSLTSEDETIDGIKNGKISGLSTTMEYATSKDANDSEYTKIIDTNMTFASGTYYIRYAETTNYSASPVAEVNIGAGRKLTVTLPQNQIGYTLTVKDKELSYNEGTTLRFTLNAGYSKTDDFSIKVNDEAIKLNDDNTYTLSNVTSDVSISVDGVKDKTAPTGTIEVSENKWNSFLNTITFGLFFKKTQTVTITGEDAGSGIASIQYYVSNEEISETDIQSASIKWIKYEKEFLIDPNNKYIIYAKITDIAGNTTYISSDGIVLDGIAPAITGVENNQTYYTTQKITVSDDYLDTVTVNGEKVTLTDGQLTLEGNVDEVYKIVVSDKAGNSTTITITMKETSTVSKEIESLKTDTVTSQDKTTIEENLNKINELLKDENLTEEERSILEELKKEAQDLLDKIEEVETEIKEVTDIINSYENITLSDRTVIQDTLERIETLLNSNHITEEERIKLNEVKEKGELLLKEINEIEVYEEENVNTGDMNQYMIYIILMILSGRYVLRLRRNEE